MIGIYGLDAVIARTLRLRIHAEGQRADGLDAAARLTPISESDGRRGSRILVVPILEHIAT